MMTVVSNQSREQSSLGDVVMLCELSPQPSVLSPDALEARV